MNILICHERFLFRFGADRALMMIGRGLTERGHKTAFLSNRCDRAILDTFAYRVVDVPPTTGEYLDIEAYTADWLRSNWGRIFMSFEPDLVLLGGWPFFSAIPLFRERGIPTIFMDCGVVPLDGYTEGHQRVLEKVISVRRQHLKHCSLIVGISDFVLHTQSIPDSEGRVPARRIWLAADHMDTGLWTAGKLDTNTVQVHTQALIERLRGVGKSLILCLGRWEPYCYKNSEATYDIIRSLRAQNIDCGVLTLAEPQDINAPEDVRNSIHAIGFPDDQELRGLMMAVDIGLSTSRWEGFNLPLAEIQHAGRAAVALRVGAHPEIIADPWFLAGDIQELAAKCGEYLRGRGPSSHEVDARLEVFKKQFTWESTIREYAEVVDDLASAAQTRRTSESQSGSPGHIIIDVTNSTRDPANSGVIRVTRRIGKTLQSLADPVFVVWDSENTRYVLPTREEFDQLGQFNGPELVSANRLSSGPDQRITLDQFLLSRNGHWLLLPETMIESRFREIRPYARARNFAIAAIFYDAIAILRPDLCNEEVRSNHAAYMRGLAECDLIIPISTFSGSCLLDLWSQWNVTTSAKVHNLQLPGEFAGAQRNRNLDVRTDGTIRILCVSTLEPRKNHRKFLAAVLKMQHQHPAIDWQLTLVGNRYAGAFDLADYVEDVCRANPRIQWLGIVDDAKLLELYREATFTVYPSTIEGFGMPILESVWHARPCVCHNDGVMAELASGGGCLTVDMDNQEAIVSALYEMSTSSDRVVQLAQAAVARPLKTWHAYARDVTALLASAEPSAASVPASSGFPTWDASLYRDCLTAKWQMNDSERLAMTGLLARHRPACCIEVGTYHGGSLSLLTQFADMVFSIDIDPTIPGRLAHLPGVSFLTGDSADLLPALLEELQSRHIPVDLFLIDGDHSGEGIRRDLSIVLGYVPARPMFVLMHDSFNPGCRQGMLNAPWQGSPYCHWVDLDFVPGRLIEHGGGGTGEMWGGLGLAYFLPVPRNGDLAIGQSAGGMFEVLRSAAYQV
ncbi:MAG: glycosyltransferase [Bryobacteraceae bacterium]|nr:glycosyltransferase [Bryobacteraceae bacterium]